SYPFNLLSERESESYRLLIQGYSNTEISHKLGLSTKTVDVYINRIKAKLNCENRKALIHKAHDSGIIEYYLDAIA
ncbi:MAG TPA: LuxR C-terminal-related transcriptional regulator, partial [Candidatus Berkiella sp.]|nr:LuxR C-terminal-related transcriptional regulator [Candidatus Berkiella sp.]